jgi:hypothetical protein
MANHIVTYDENGAGTMSRAKCTCRWAGPWRQGGAEKTHVQLDRDAERHIDQQS